jgi:hypothetical protein
MDILSISAGNPVKPEEIKVSCRHSALPVIVTA